MKDWLDMEPWIALALDTTRLGLEAQKVIELRVARLMALGPDAPFEAQLMVAEKGAAFVQAALSAGAMLALGNEGHAVTKNMIRGYRRHVRANRRRLAKAA